MALFDRYLFADYSGAGENHHAQRSIRIYRASGYGEPERIRHTVSNPQTGEPQNFSRNELCARVIRELEDASEAGDRVVFGFDHQYAWPSHLRQHAGVVDLDWRTALLTLSSGDLATGLPALDIPSRYCAAFNQFCGNPVFWSPMRGAAENYGIANLPLGIPPTQRFRLTELMAPYNGNAQPKPADEIGGRGSVAGQTICGMHQIARMLADETVAWWPFDGFDIASDNYHGKHVGVEIYPSALRPHGIDQDDDNDAYHSCLYVRESDQNDELAGVLTLAPPEHLQVQIEKEGWIVGMNPEGLFAYAGPTVETLLNQIDQLTRRLRELEPTVRELDAVE